MLRSMSLITWAGRRLAIRSLRTKFAWITPELIQGPSFPSKHAHLLAKLGIDSVLDLREPDGHDTATIAVANVHYYHHPMREFDPPTLAQLEEGVRWSLGEMAAGRSVLVHCRVGQSRSACMACAILIGQGHGLSSALQTVKAARRDMILSSDQLLELEALESRVQSGQAPLGDDK